MSTELLAGVFVGGLASIPCILLSLGVVWWSLKRCQFWESELMACRAVMTVNGIPEPGVDHEDFEGD